MKKLALSAICLFVCLGCLAAQPPAVEKVKRTYHLHSKRYDKGEYFALRNDQNSYLLYLQWIKETAKSQGEVVIGLPEPCFWHGFIARDFMSVEVNGIKSRILEPKSMTTFTEKDKAGVDILYNFDGIGMIFRYFVTADSPFLQFQLKKAPDCQTPVTSLKVHISVHPSFTLPNGGKKDARYQREILTPARTIQTPGGTNTGWFSLKPTDTSLIMYDKGATPEGVKGRKGPCRMNLDWTGIQKARVWFGKIYCMSFEFTLKPDAPSWNFGFLEFSRPMENQEFIQKYSK